MKLLLVAMSLTTYPVGKPGFHGGTEEYVAVLSRGLAALKHEVHVIAPDLEQEEQRGPHEWWWPPGHHPTAGDAVIAFHNLANLEYDADLLIFASNGIGADTSGLDTQVDAAAVFSNCHADLLAGSTGIPRERCIVTGLGVDLGPYPLDDQSEPGRLFVSNDPARGLWHVLDIFDLVKREMPDTTLHVGYDFGKQFEQHRWDQNAMAEMFWECRRRISKGDGILDLGALSRPGVILEQIECRVHCWPSDPPNIGSQIHGLTQMECAAAGCALVLSDVEAFPEVFGDGASILPVIGRFYPGPESRVDAQDYAAVVLRLLRDQSYYRRMRRRAQKLAARNTWRAVVRRWDTMLTQLADRRKADGQNHVQEA